MDIYNGIIEKQALMMEAYKDFRDLCDALKNERSLGGDVASEYAIDSNAHEMAESPVEEMLEELEEQNCERSYDEFPQMLSFSFKDIDPNDPAFSYGKSIGIPRAVVVRDAEGQDKLLPIVNGRFSTDVL